MSTITYDVFISYRSTDRALAEDLYQRLSAAGFRVWFDVEALDRVGRWHAEIEAGCEASRVILPVLTPDWESQWTQYETYGGEAVVPLVFAGEGPMDPLVPVALREWQALDMRGADEATWERLFRRLREHLAAPAAEKSARTAGLPFAANPYFVGREALLVEIHTKLHQTPTTALTHDPAFVLAGMGGIGKTTLARQYAEKFWRLYQDLLWVSAANVDLLPFEFSRLAVQMGLLCAPSDDAMRDAQLALRALESGPPRLLIVDNAENEASVREWLPKSGQCHTLITSRFTSWSPEVQTVTVPLLEPEPSRELLLRRSGLPDSAGNRAAADALAADLGYLPLALEQAAAYIQQQRLGLEAYRERFAQYRGRLLDRRQPGGTNYRDSVATTWQITVEKLSVPARGLLQLLAFVAPAPLPRQVLTDAKDLLREALGDDLLDEGGLEEALGELQRYSLITLKEADGPLSIHRLLQAVQEDGLSAAEQDAWARRALQAVRRAFPKPDHTNWPICEALVPHALVVGAHGKRRQLVLREVGLLPGLVGAFYQLRGQMSASRAPSAQAVDAFVYLAAADLGNALWQHDLSVSHARLGGVWQAQGDLKEARQAHEAAMTIMERLATDAPGNALWQHDLSISHNNLGDVRVAQGDLAGALREYEAAMAIAQRLVAAAPDNAQWQRDLAVSHNNLGDVLVAQGDLTRALAEYEAAMAIVQRLGAADPGNTNWQRDLAISNNKLGDVRQVQGDLTGGKKAYEAALIIVQRLATADPGNAEWQRDLAICHGNLGNVQKAQGDLVGARQAYEAAMNITAQLVAADPSNTNWQRDLSVSHEWLGDVRKAQGDLPEARQAYEEVMVIRERLAAADPDNADWHQNLGVCYERLGDMRVAQGDLPEARQAYEAAMAIFKRLVAADPGNTEWQRDLAINHNRLGDAILYQGNLAGARQAYEAAMAIAQRLAAADPGNAEWKRDLAVCHNNLGDVRVVQGDLMGALRECKETHVILARLATADPGNAQWQRDLAVSHIKLFQVCKETGHQDQAIENLLRCRETLRSMKARGMHLDPPMASLLEQLEELQS